MDSLVQQIRDYFHEHRNPVDAPIMKSYMKNQFDFFGIKKPQRLFLIKNLLGSHKGIAIKALPDFVQLLWQQPEREMQYVGNDFNEFNVQHFPESYLKHIEWCITQKPWWDTVDTLSVRVLGVFFEKHPHLKTNTIDRFLNMNNIWLQRACLIFQLKYKEKTDKKLLLRSIETLKSSEDFFIQKAIGWALREYSKTDKYWVVHVVKSVDIAPFSKKEALKWLSNKDRL